MSTDATLLSLANRCKARRLATALTFALAVFAPALAAQSIVYGRPNVATITSADIFGRSLVTNNGSYDFYSDGFSLADPATGNAVGVAGAGGPQTAGSNEYFSFATADYAFTAPQSGGELFAFNLLDVPFQLAGVAGTPVQLQFFLTAVFTPGADPAGVTQTRAAHLFVDDITSGVAVPILIYNSSHSDFFRDTPTLSLDLTLDPARQYSVRTLTESNITFADVAPIESQTRLVELSWQADVTASIVTPEPSALILFATGLAGVAAARRRAKR